MKPEFHSKGIVVGSITVIVTFLLLSILMPAVFMDLVRTGKMDVLITSFWPQIYTLGTVFISGVSGVYVGSVIADNVKWKNSIAIILVSLLLTYIVNQPVSEFARIYPAWVTNLSYLICFSSLLVGHYLTKFIFVKNLNNQISTI